MQIKDGSELPIAREIADQTDRGAAIIAAAYLEDNLNAALKSRLVRDSKSAASYAKLFKRVGPIGSLASKIEIGFLIGLYTHETKEDMLLISEIRNQFAHLTKILRFDSRDIRGKCDKLTFATRALGDRLPVEMYGRPLTRENAKLEFITTIGNISAHLRACANSPNYKGMI